MAGKIQNEDIKSVAELTGAGGQKSQLPNTDKVYIESFSEQKTLKEAIDERLIHGTPMEMHQNYPADARLFFEPSTINTIDGKGRTVPPIKSQIPAVDASWINFQTGAMFGATFDVAFPSTTIGYFRRLGFTLLSNGVIKGIFSNEAGSIGALANPGTVFVKGSLPLGYVDLEATGTPGGLIWNKSATNTTNFPITTTKNLGATATFGAPYSVTKARLSLTYVSGVGSVYCDVYQLPSPGSPPGVSDLPIGTSDPVDITTLPTGSLNPALTEFTFTTPVPVAAGIEYGFVARLSSDIPVVNANRFLTAGGDPTMNQIFRNTDFSTSWFYTAEDISLQVEAASMATTFKTAGSATDIIEHKVGSAHRVVSFGSGGGGSGGTGDATAFRQALEDRLMDSLWGKYTPIEVVVEEETMTDPSSTAIYDIANSEYDFTAGQFFLSKNLYNDTFLAAQQDNIQVEVWAEWSVPDPAAVYEISKDGGASYEAITTMEQIGDSARWRGVFVMDEPPGAVIVEYPVSNASTLAELNTTTRQSYAVKLPTVGIGEKRRVLTSNVYIHKTGSATGSMSVKLVSDNGGVPGTTILGANSQYIDLGLLAPNADHAIAIDMPSIITAQDWWLVFDTSQGYKTGFSAGVTSVSVRVDNTSPTYAQGDSYQYNGTVWSAHAGNQAVFQLFGYDFDLRLKITASQAASITGMAVFYAEGSPETYDDVQSIERFDLDGSANVTTLSLTKFIPDPMTCKVYVVNSGQVLRYPAFGIDGRNLIFASGQFLLPGQTVTVLVDQMGYGAFDNSDRNGALLAANRLGSTDPAFDLSAAGEGILLRADNNVLVEASLRWNGAAYEWQFASIP